ncbi:SRPBCC family protein [Pontibacter sp. G13]|uniref:SRPBCC family protein n=1 Tax=Pontibacter sp. G13 TaxID=3074898 RepID=UPI00288A9790|nr:SRPBCC family protein [Pontibacter sp. G13]WNJ18335.1 SRPBCC family protein [Pontibacter sp. G13]
MLLQAKWLGVGGLILVILLALYFLGKKSVHASVSVPVSPDQVWKLLTNLDQVQAWNKILVPKEGQLIEGQEITYDFHDIEKSSSEIKARVQRLIPNQEIQQSGGMPGILTFHHRYILTPEAGGTRVEIREEYRGIMVPFWSPASVGASYQQLLDDLKTYITTPTSPQ